MKDDGDLGTVWREAQALDLTGLKCPMPALLTAKALRAMSEGACLAVTVSDQLAPLDIRHLCNKEGHEFLGEAQNESGTQRLLVRRGPRF